MHSSVTGVGGGLTQNGADILAVWFTDDAENLYTHIQTVNNVKAIGGGLEGPGAIVSGGMLYFNSGYGGFVGRRADPEGPTHLELAHPQAQRDRGDRESHHDERHTDPGEQVGRASLLGRVDRLGRLVFIDYAGSEAHLRSETPLPPSLSWLVDEGYRGPLVFRIDPAEDRPLPRRADLLIPILPRRESPRPDREAMWRLIGVTATPGDDLVFLSSVGEVLRLAPDGELRLVVRLPAGHYHRTNLTSAPDGSIFVCAGYQIRKIFRISPAGRVSVVASELGDPGGIVLDAKGALYVPEAAVHRIIRIAPDP